MSTSTLSVSIKQLLAELRSAGDDRTDEELLSRFVRSRDEDALAALVNRHASMVWGVCRRQLRNTQDAEDAFQATFLVLVRKASCVPGHAVPNWLYGVARQTAVRVLTTVAKRGNRETQVVNLPETAMKENRDDDLQIEVDAELSRLPGHYRGVVILCDLEGMTRKEAARQLGIPEGSVASRLARARALLAKRLQQRGVVFSGSVAAVLSAGSASSAPPALVVSTIKAAGLLAAGSATGVVSAKIVALTEGVIKAMFITKLKSAIVMVVAIVIMGTGGTSLAFRMAKGQDGEKSLTDDPSNNAVVVQENQKPSEELSANPKEENILSLKDLIKIEPPGGVPLPLVKPGTKVIGADQLNKVRRRLESVPEKEFEQWVVQLERIMDVKLKDGLPSPRQACRTDFAVRMSKAFNDVDWNPKLADNLYKRACAMPAKETKSWKAAFETLLKKEIGIKLSEQEKPEKEIGPDKCDFENLPGGPPWAVPLVLIPVDALHEDQKYSAERGKKYLARLNQLSKDDVALWREMVDKFGGTELDAAVNIILIDDFFSKENFQRDKFKAAVERQDEKKPNAEKSVVQAANSKEANEAFTAWGKEVGGLQAGLGLLPGAKRVYQHGETLTLCVRVRNVGKKEVTFEYIRQFLDENRPTVTDARGKVIDQSGTTMLGIHGPTEVSLKPGQEIVLETRMHGASGSLYALLPESGGLSSAKAWPLFVGNGKFGLQFERVIGNSSSGFLKSLDPALGKLATGKLELEIKQTEDKPHSKQGMKLTVDVAKKLLAPAAGISNADFEELLKDPRSEALKNKSLSLVLLALRPPKNPDAASAKEAAKEFRILGNPIDMSKLIEATWISKGDGYASFIQPKYITECSCESTTERAEGIVTFENAHFAGRIPFVAEATKDGWIITEFRLPQYKTKVVRGKDGVWSEEKLEEEAFTAWGKEAGGLQAGLGLLPGAKRVYQHGETVTLLVRVRNVGKKAVTFEYIRQFLDENRPTVTDANGKAIGQSGTTMFGTHGPTRVTLEPGKEIVLETRIHGASGSPYALLPEIGGTSSAKVRLLLVGTGKVGLQFERVIGNSSSGSLNNLDPVLSKLATGKLELEVKEPEKLPQEKKEPLTAWGKEVDGLQAGIRLKAIEVLNAQNQWETMQLVGKIHQGSVIRFEVIVRNVSKQDVMLKYIQPSGWPCAETGRELKFAPVYMGGKPISFEKTLQAGENWEVAQLNITTRKLTPTESFSGLRLVELGKFKVSCPSVLSETKLATGELEIEILSPNRQAEK